jgi:hypothetical protein
VGNKDVKTGRLKDQLLEKTLRDKLARITQEAPDEHVRLWAGLTDASLLYFIDPQAAIEKYRKNLEFADRILDKFGGIQRISQERNKHKNVIDEWHNLANFHEDFAVLLHTTSAKLPGKEKIARLTEAIRHVDRAIEFSADGRHPSLRNLQQQIATAIKAAS